MKYELYQVDMRKANEIAFMPYDEIDHKKVWFKNYDMVNSGEVDYDKPEKILSYLYLWEMYNGMEESEYTHRSMSISDVVVLYDEHTPKAYYCDSFGWKEIDYEYFFRDLYDSNPVNPDYLSKEKELVKKLADIYNEFSQLYSQHSNELSDFADGIHRCQYVLAMRMARHHYPDLFPNKLDKN